MSDDENIFKRRAILIDFELLKLDRRKKPVPNYFLLKLCDNLEVSGYSDLIILAKHPEEAREWADKNCLGEQVLIYKTNYNLGDDIQHIKSTHKTIGAIISKKYNYDTVNQRLVQIAKILGR